jgi:hypothetical protein
MASFVNRYEGRGRLLFHRKYNLPSLTDNKTSHVQVNFQNQNVRN